MYADANTRLTGKRSTTRKWSIWAIPDGKHGPLYEYDVSWKDGPKDEEEGILKEGEFVPVVDEMKFDVKFTDRS